MEPTRSSSPLGVPYFNVMGHKKPSGNSTSVLLRPHDGPPDDYLEFPEVEDAAHSTNPDMDYLRVNPDATIKVHHVHKALDGALVEDILGMKMYMALVLEAVKPVPETNPPVCRPIPQREPAIPGLRG